MIKKITAEVLAKWVEELIQTQCVYGPLARNGKFVYSRLASAAELRLDFDVTVLPPKVYFQPPCETLLRFKGAQYESVFDTTPFVVFGVHPYDMVAIQQMDHVFTADRYDAHYAARRKRSVVVVCDVQRPSNHVFASCMGTAVLRKGGDVLLTKIDSGYVVEAHTEAGRQLMDFLRKSPDASAEDLAAREAVWARNERELKRYVLRVKPEELPALLERSYDHPIWKEKAQHCFSCGSCNLVCPTCYCFNVQEDTGYDLVSGTRVRIWDGCMLTDFALVAGGHNFRKDRADRYRHRYYRKGKYLHDRYRQIACVGCGRCIAACVTKIANPVEVYNSLLEVEAAT